MNNARNVTAVFLPTYALSVSVTGNGTVTSNDGTINCGSQCSSTYVSGTMVILTANPASQWMLASWSGCDSVNGNVCTVTMDRARSVSTVQRFALSVSLVGGGAVTSADGYVNCSATCSQNYVIGSFVTLTANPAQNWVFTSWSGCDSMNGNTCYVTMNSARSVTATFAITYPLTVAETGNGSITSSDGFINCGSLCAHRYTAYSPVTLSANAGLHWTLTGWTGCDRVQGTICTVSMYAARNVMASFKMVYGLGVSRSGNGTVISGDGFINCGTACSHNYPNGATLALTATPAVGNTVSNWVGCNSTQGNVCFVTINGSTSASATFSPVTVSFGSLTFSPTPARYGITTVGTLTLATPAPVGGVALRVTSSKPNIVAVPSTLYVPGGASVIRFGLHVISPRPMGITVTATDTHSSVIGMLQVVPGADSSTAPSSSTKAAPGDLTMRPAELRQPTVREATSAAPE
jgi:hypothetical protein